MAVYIFYDIWNKHNVGPSGMDIVQNLFYIA